MPRTAATETRHVSFDVPSSAAVHLNTIIDRLAALSPRLDRLSTRMDLCATHANGCPLDFDRLAAADDFNLMHDVFGIARHLDRSTGQLDGRFLPRFATKTTDEELAPAGRGRAAC